MFAGGLEAPVVVVSRDHFVAVEGKKPAFFLLRRDHLPWSDITRWSTFVHADLAARARSVDTGDTDDRIDMEKELLPRVRRGLPIVAASFHPGRDTDRHKTHAQR